MRLLCNTSKRNRNDQTISFYKSYHAGKYLALAGSVAICLGLMTWFFVRTQSNSVSAVTFAITLLGVVLFILGVVFFFKAVYHTYKAQSKAARERKTADPGPVTSATGTQAETQQ